MRYFWLFFAGLLISMPAWAKIEYSATVPVDVDAENSVVAKEHAMLEAQRKAFLQIAGQLTSEENVQKLNELTDDAIAYFVQSVGVADEKAGGTKYIANLTVQVKEDLLKDYLAENEMIQSDSIDLVVVPVLQDRPDGYPLLWEENNDWLHSWRSKGQIKFGTMGMRALNDNYRNIDGLNAQGALYMEADVYTKIAEMSGSENVYVIYAEKQQNGDLKVTIKSVKTKAEDSFTVAAGADIDLYEEAIKKSVMFISNMQREAKNADDVAAVNNINAVYAYQDMKDWLNKSKSISDLPQVEGIDTKSFGGGKVNFTIRYTGNLDDLWTALQEIGLSHEVAGNYFIIR
ncbi:MAG: hypothetical protein J6N49_00945 [Alphaproteobacteria bacterium]|nr:hypothetical protein [Alphaproteobacteria bacterium]